MSSSLKRVLAEAPRNYGLLITFDSENRTCQMEFVPDQHLETIHPNAYGPVSLEELESLGGGGSGVRVFRGHHQQLGDVVMKHGVHTDTKELFALATIAEELQHRNPEAHEDMKWRLPEFKMLYISPCHLREKPRKLWSFLSKALGLTSHHGDKSDHSDRTSDTSCHTLESHETDATESERETERDICLYTSSSHSKVRVYR